MEALIGGSCRRIPALENHQIANCACVGQSENADPIKAIEAKRLFVWATVDQDNRPLYMIFHAK
jgi:hypothetical protein